MTFKVNKQLHDLDIKNNFIKVFKNLGIDLKVILLAYQNNYERNSSMRSNEKSFNILISSFERFI